MGSLLARLALSSDALDLVYKLVALTPHLLCQKVDFRTLMNTTRQRTGLCLIDQPLDLLSWYIALEHEED